MGPTATVPTAQEKEMSVHCQKSIPDPQTIQSTDTKYTVSYLVLLLVQQQIP
jgi:hypothetical protein